MNFVSATTTASRNGANTIWPTSSVIRLAALNGTLNLDEVLDLILTNIGFVMPHDAANIMLVEDGTAYVVRETGFSQRGLGDWILALRLPVAEHREPQTDVGNGAAGMHLRFASRSQLAAASGRRLAVFVCRSAASLSGPHVRISESEQYHA